MAVATERLTLYPSRRMGWCAASLAPGSIAWS